MEIRVPILLPLLEETGLFVFITVLSNALRVIEAQEEFFSGKYLLNPENEFCSPSFLLNLLSFSNLSLLDSAAPYR